MRDYERDQAVAVGPPCKTCVHYMPMSARCTHLAMTERTYRRVEGKWEDRAKVGAHLARSEDGLCGPEALLFDPLPTMSRFTALRRNPFIFTAGFIAAMLAVVWIIGLVR